MKITPTEHARRVERLAVANAALGFFAADTRLELRKGGIVRVWTYGGLTISKRWHGHGGTRTNGR